ncbi:uncharacterized protein LOC113567196 [Drosophila persimilis]|uniref:uncharacterized protein LOC113567196 n=1 Tax=Drosophila persimilis TaxID=7234 RepID=UPI000F07B4C8|nr:uncharacterized protein LOC113567196 [Drosophila persimilis]
MASHPHVNLLHAAEPHYYNAQGAVYYTSYHGSPHDLSYASSADVSLNASWVNASGHSPHTPYYSAAQIYMRPKGGSTTPTPSCSGSTGSGSGSGSGSCKKVPPEVPKRTSSITAQQQSQRCCGPTGSARRRRTAADLRPEFRLRLERHLGGAEHEQRPRIGPQQLPHTWKRGTALNSSQQFSTHSADSVSVRCPAEVEVEPLWSPEQP